MSLSKSVKSEFVVYKPDGVWQYFLREKNGQYAKCKRCENEIKTAGGTTTGLHVHLRTKHDIDFKKRPSEDSSANVASGSGVSGSLSVKKSRLADSGTGPGTLANFMMNKDERSLEATIARMAARDRLPFRVFASSPDMRKALMLMGFSQIPKSVHTIKKMVMDHGERVKSFVTGEMRQLKKEGHRFSLTFDEWTSSRNQRYMCVNVHDEWTSSRNRRYMCVNVHGKDAKFWSLGLVRVHGTMPADKCVTLLESRLSAFGLSLSDDIVCIVTDGASVMTKVGKLIKPAQQLCHAHGIQLAVLEVLYNSGSLKHNVHVVIEDQLRPQQRQQVTVLPPAESDDDDNDDDDYEDDDVNESMDDSDIIAEMSNSYKDVVHKVRTIVKLFKRSPTKNDDVLQKYVKMENQGRELSLTLDCRTRWSSLWQMLSTFYRLRNSIQKACIDVNASVSLTDVDITLINEIVSALEPVKMSVERL
jgi:hypothetical protein